MDGTDRNRWSPVFRRRFTLLLLVVTLVAVVLLFIKLKPDERFAAWLNEQWLHSDFYAELERAQRVLAADNPLLRWADISYASDNGVGSAKVTAYLTENKVGDEQLARDLAYKVLKINPDFFRKKEVIEVDLIYEFDPDNAASQAEQHYRFTAGELKANQPK